MLKHCGVESGVNGAENVIGSAVWNKILPRNRKVGLSWSRMYLPKKPWSVTHRNPAWTSRKLVLEKDNTFATLNISSTIVLDDQSEMQVCSFCNKSQKVPLLLRSIAVAAVRRVLARESSASFRKTQNSEIRLGKGELCPVQ